MRKLLLVILISPVLGFGQDFYREQKLPLKYASAVRDQVDEFTGDVTWTHYKPSYFYVKTVNGESELYVKIGVRRAINKPQIQKLLFKVGGKVIEVERNDRDFKTTEVVKTKHTYQDNLKIQKQRNADQVFIDEFVGSYTNYKNLIELLAAGNSIVRIEEEDMHNDLEISKTESARHERLLDLYKYLKEKEGKK